MPNPVPPGTWFAAGSTVKPQNVSTSNQLYFGASFMQQSGQINGGSATPEHRDVAPSKRRQIVMRGAMRKKLRRQVCQVFGHIFEVGNPNGQYNPPSFNEFAIIESQEKSGGRTIEIDNQSVFKFWNHAFLKGKPVGSKRVKAYRTPQISVFDSPFGAKVF
jgi:hypothetical protein